MPRKATTEKPAAKKPAAKKPRSTDPSPEELDQLHERMEAEAGRHNQHGPIVDLGGGIELRFMHVDELIEQDVNARTMQPEMFQRLQETIARDKRLEQLPFCADTDRGVEIISGHHRTRAARASKVSVIPVMVDVSGLSRAQIKAKQLAHNNLAGYDDPDVMARIYQEIDDMEARLEAFVDESKLAVEPIGNLPAPGLSLQIDYRTTTIAFLPKQEERFVAAVEAIADRLATDKVFLSDMERVEQFRDIVATARKHYDVRALGAVLDAISSIVLEHLGITVDVEEDTWRPLVDLGGGGGAMVPPDAAAVIEQLVDRVRVQADDPKMPLWRCLELVSADFLAGV